MRDTAGRTPAHDLDAEAAVLSAILVARGIDQVADALGPDDFYADANRKVYESALELRREGKPVDIVTVAGLLRSRDMLAGIGGAAYLAQIADAIPSVEHLGTYARTVADKARVRRMVAECQRIASEGYGDVGDACEWIDRCESSIHALAQDRATDRLTDMRVALHRVFSEIQNPPAVPRGIPTGLRKLDHIMGPMRAGQLVLIGALSGIGKSALALNVTLSVASLGLSVLVFSAEMEADELATRALFSDARVDTFKTNYHHRLTPDDFTKLTDASQRVSRSTILIDDRPNISPLQVRSVSRRVQARPSGAPLGMIVVDYIQLLDGKNGLPKGANREQEVAEISRNLKVLAKEMQVPVLALAQLNSDSEKAPSGGRKPRMNDLRESKAIAQNADKIILIHNPHAVERAETYRDDKDEQLPGEMVDLIVAKNRGGRTGTVQATFWPSCTLFEDS